MQKTTTRATISEETFISIVIKDKRGRKSLGGIILPPPPPRADFDRGRRVELRLRFSVRARRPADYLGLKGTTAQHSVVQGWWGGSKGGRGWHRRRSVWRVFENKCEKTLLPPRSV